jgi:hypothetical protein
MLLDLTEKVFSFDIAIFVQVANRQNVTLFELSIIGSSLLYCIIREMGEETTRI